MAKIRRVLLAVVSGLLIGSVVNMGLIVLGAAVVPLPVGADVTTVEGLRTSLAFFGPEHFVFPFLALAHALGTTAGAFVADLVAPTRAAGAAYTVGGLFLLGGIANGLMLPAPAWFVAVDLLFAYLPAAWLGWTLARRMSRVGARGA